MFKKMRAGQKSTILGMRVHHIDPTGFKKVKNTV